LNVRIRMQRSKLVDVIAPLDTKLLHSTAVRLQVQSVRLRGLTFRFSGTSAASLHVAGCGLISDLAAQTVASYRLMWPGVCGRWLPI